MFKSCKRHFFSALTALFLAAIAYHPAHSATATLPLALTNVTVIDTAGGPAQPNMVVLVTGSRITAVGRTLTLPAGAHVVDAKGKYMIPGLWDMHVHFTHNRDGMTALFIANGVTSVRDMGGDLDLIDAIRAKVNNGQIVGPHIIRAGPFLEGPGHTWHPESSRIIVNNEAEARRAVATLKARGVDFIKMHGGVSLEVLRAIVDEAKKQGLMVVGHPTVAPADVSDAGQIDIEHHVMSGDPAADKALMAKFLKNGTWIAPTMISTINGQNPINDTRLRYIPRTVLAKWDENWPVKKRTPDEVAAARKERATKAVGEARQLAAAGVPLLAGTDTGFRDLFPGFSLHDELALMVQAGMTPLQALQTATLNPAKFLGTLNSEGTIAPGQRADLVLLNGNPLDDINQVRNISDVVVAGHYLSRSDLDKLLTQAETMAAR